MKRNSIFYWLAGFIFLAFVGFTISGEEGLIRLFQLHQSKKGLLAKNRSLLFEHLAMRQELSALKNIGTIEHRAHEFLGLVHADEIIYIIPK